MEAARSIREDFLNQNSFDEVDTYSSLRKQYLMMKLVVSFYDKAEKALSEGADMNALIAMPIREDIGRFKYVKEEDIEQKYTEIEEELDVEISQSFIKED